MKTDKKWSTIKEHMSGVVDKNFVDNHVHNGINVDMEAGFPGIVTITNGKTISFPFNKEKEEVDYDVTIVFKYRKRIKLVRKGFYSSKRV